MQRYTRVYLYHLMRCIYIKFRASLIYFARSHYLQLTIKQHCYNSSSIFNPQAQATPKLRLPSRLTRRLVTTPPALYPNGRIIHSSLLVSRAIHFRVQQQGRAQANNNIALLWRARASATIRLKMALPGHISDTRE